MFSTTDSRKVSLRRRASSADLRRVMSTAVLRLRRKLPASSVIAVELMRTGNVVPSLRTISISTSRMYPCSLNTGNISLNVRTPSGVVRSVKRFLPITSSRVYPSHASSVSLISRKSPSGPSEW